jgi:hypothetical protein
LRKGSILSNRVKIIVISSAIILLIITGSAFSSIAVFGLVMSNNGSSIPQSVSKKSVILIFYDNPKSQFIYAKPILDKYGFKASFFIVCNWIESDKSRMNWQDISALQKEGHDIESHTMNHKSLIKMSAKQLNYEVGQSRQCLADHGINATVFSPPHGNDWNNATVIDTVAKYYNLALGGFSDLMYLHCDGLKKYSNQTDCRTYDDNGRLNFVNRYSIREWSHNKVDMTLNYSDSQIFPKFLEEVHEQDNLTSNNSDGTVNAIPIVVYHNIDNNKTQSSTNVNLFAAEMKYLHENGFKVYNMADVGYDKNHNYLYIKH